MTAKTTFLAAIVSSAAVAHAGSFDLGNYHHVATHNLPPVAASEASGVTYNWDTNTLFVIGDEGLVLVEVDLTGTQQSVMTLTGFADTEGVTYLGSNQFVIAEERLQDLFLLTYVPGGSVDRSTLSSISLGDTVGNVGIEGVSFDPLNNLFIAVKEKTPQAVKQAANVNFPAGTATVTDLFAPALGVLDLSDVQVLTTVPSLAGMPDADNLLIYSQESELLMEVTRAGDIQSTFDFAALTPFDDAEGVTIGPDGTIYVVEEGDEVIPRLYVLKPIPEPSVVLLLGAALPALLRRRAAQRV